MEIVIGVAAKVAEYTVGPIVRPIARRCPFKNLWEYTSNLENLKTELKNLEAKRESVQGLTDVGVEPLPDVMAWQDKVTNIIRDVSGLISEDNPQQQSVKCCKGCTYSNLKECYQHRNNVARKLKDVTQLLQEAMKSTNLWEYKSNLENLKKEMEKLEARRESVQHLIKDGEEPLQHVKLWQENVNKIIAEVSRLINPQQQNMQCCNGLTCSDLDICYRRSNNVARILGCVALLLQEARDFREVSTISEETAYKSNLQKLKMEVEALKFKRESVQRLIKVGEEPLPDVKVWQDRVKKIIDEVPGLTIEHNPEHQNKVAQVLKEIAQLLQEAAQFREVSRPSIPQQTCLQPSTQQEFSESRMSILKDIIAALTKADVNMVGIYGMGGVGKTTLAKKVGSQAMQDKLFDKIVFVEVSQSPDIRIIQGVIADHVGLQIEGETVPGRSSKLCDYLKKGKKKILIILDNLWKGIKLEEEVGIPFGNVCKGLKLLLTARSRDVLTKGMDSEHNFHVEALSEANAWILFKSIVGTCIDHPHLKSVAQEVAKKCGGMPLAIENVAKALKGTEAKEEWTEALRRLDNPSPEGFEREVYNCIKLSYDRLDGKLIKEIFLLCSRMGRTHDASVQDLFRYGLGLGLFEEFDTVEAALSNVQASVNQLKAASLLLDAHAPDVFFRPSTLDHERFAIHDVICAVARAIAFEDRRVLFVLQSLTNENKLKNCTSISLYNIGELPKDLKLVCPQLKFLYVNPMLLFPKTHSRISDKFFAWMPRLQVLHLIQMDVCSTSLSDLVNLQTLCLEYCALKDIADIGDLKNLEILSFRNCKGFQLPEKLPQLTKLRLLELKCYGCISIPSEFILSFKKLEALYMDYTTIKGEVEKSNNGSRNASREVLEHLSNLTSLEIHVPDDTMSRGLLSPKLERYSIKIGGFSLQDTRLGWNIRCKTSRFLQVKLITNEDGIISRLKPIRQLVLDEVPGIANNFCGLDRMGFPELEDLKVQNNSHIVHIVDAVSGDGAFPVLKSLILWNLINLKTICNGSLGMKLFHQLRTIKVGKCYELTNLFSLASDRVFQELEEIEVEHCEKMKEIFAISEQVHEIKFSKLCILRLTSLPQLESLCCNVKTTSPILEFTSDIKREEIILEEERDVSKPLFNENVEVTNLETLEINNINVKSIWDNQLPTMANIPYLTCLIISNLPNLTRLSSGDYIKFPLLKEMTIKSCPKFKEFFFDDKVGVPSIEKINIFNMDNLKMIWHNQLVEESFPKLKSLQVQECHNLTRLGSGDYIKFPLLKEMTIKCCPKFKEFFFDDKVGVPSLEKINIFNMDNLKMIWHNQLVDESFSKLKSLQVQECLNLTRLGSGDYIKFPLLKEMTIKSCPKFKEFFFDDKVGVPSIEKINIFNMDNLKMIWHNQFVEESFPKLKSLQVQECHNLTRLGSGDYIKFPLLKEITIKCCPKFKEVFFDDKVGVPSLQKVNIFKMENLKMIWHNQFVEDSFSKLKSLQVQECHKLLTLFQSNMCGRFSSLETLNVGKCGSLQEIFDLRGINSKESHLTTSTQNRELCTYSPLVLSFANLRNLKVSKCQSLKTIVAKEEVEAKEVPGTVRFVFPKLTSLGLYKLPELRTFYPGRYVTEWPVLKTLKMHQCEIHDTNNRRVMQQLPLLSNEVSFEFQVGEIWPNLLLTKSSWVQNLTTLTLHGCDNLEELFPYSMVVTEKFSEKKMGNTIVFPKLNYLEMKQLANLKELCSGCHIEFPTLKEFKISDCSELTTFIFNDKIKVPSLTKLKISSMDNLKMIWDNQLAENSISKLKSLQVQGCCKVLTWPQWNMCESFSSLETLDISDCGSLEEIFDLHAINSEERHFATSTQSKELYTTAISFANLQNLKVSECGSLKSLFSVSNVAKDRGEAEEMHATARFVFPKLTSLELYKLSKLRTFYPARYTVEWPVLRRLWQCDCYIFDMDKNILMPSQPFPHKDEFYYRFRKMDGLEILVESSWLSWLLPMISSSFQNLTKLVVYGCGNLKELFPSSSLVEEELKEKKMENAVLFPNLEFLKMEYLANLTRLCSGYYIEFPSLKECNISNCPELKAFIFDHEVKVPSLTKLKISSMDNLKMIWDNQLAENFIPKLKSLQVQGCQKLLTLFQSNLYGRFLSLEILDVSDCGSLEEIFDLRAINSKERHFATSTQFNELCTSVFSFTNLQKLKVSKCGSLKTLFSVSNVAKDRGEAEEMHATARFVFPKLTSLHLYNLPELITFYPIRYTVEWLVLRWLQLYNYGIPNTDDEEQIQHLLFLVKKAVPCLENLILSGSELMMMWQGQDLEPLFRNFKILEVLDESKADYLFYRSQPALHYIGDVKYMWKQNFKLDLILPNFEKIVVGRCDSFISLMPPSASFRNLTSLEVYDCNSLEHIGTFSTAKILVKLVSLRIYRCEKMVEVLRNHEDVTGDKILFSNLKSLSLEDLPSLTSFCSWNFTLEFPSLEELAVRQCPNMKIFSKGELTTPKLHEVKSGWLLPIKLCPEVDVSTAIQQLHEQEQAAESFTEYGSDFSTDELE